MRQAIVGVMGPGEQATATDWQLAYDLGQRIARQGWILLTGGRSVGVMDAASRGAKQAQGLTIGILPDSKTTDVSAAVDIVIPTGMGNARNVINILSSQVVIACGMGSGTASEVALALKAQKPVILLNVSATCAAFFQELSVYAVVAQNPEAAIELARQALKNI
ncbi:MAG: TIGR00725 family protein [Leptolyngbya sp. IPPAS B-1204]|nr:TIGR00725 family protein [Elainella sp. C42_A2020_010]RNJ68145.1 MAG: TIGR00725 family protein [Leptolyngbya sp. IPPAS B-1204]